MYDQQISLTMAEGKGIGLADVIIRQMRGVGGDQPKNEELLATNETKSDAGVGFPLNREMENKGFPLDMTQSGYALPEKKTEYELPIERARSVSWGKNSDTLNSKPITASIDVPILSRVSVTDQAGSTEKKSLESNSLESTSLKSMLRHAFPTAAAFVEVITPYAKAAANELGIDVNAIIAQAALETGWGNHIIKDSDGKSSLNLFGIKSNAHWAGDRTTVKTLEYKDGIAAKETADFRSYKSMDAAFQDYISFLKNNPRYKHALENTNTAKDWGFQLQQAGYATDPNYGKKIASIVSRLSSSDKN